MVRTRSVVAVVLVVLLGLTAGSYGLRAVDGPRVTGVENEWGTVTEDRTEVESRIDVRNPRMLRVGDTFVDVRYVVELNDVRMANETMERVRLHGAEDTVAVSTWFDNDDIAAWWVTHVDRNETTTVTVDPTVTTTHGGVEFEADAWTRNRTFHTDLLAPLQSDETRRITAFDRTVFVVEETDAHWGNATIDRTPIRASITVTNQLPVAIPITDLSYTIRMNGIVVGSGVVGDERLIPAESTRTIDARAHLDNAKLDDWWVTHLRNDETTTFSVDFEATVEYRGIERQLDLDFMSYDTTFQTDVWAATAASNESVDATESVEAAESGGSNEPVEAKDSDDVSAPSAVDRSFSPLRPHVGTWHARPRY